MPDGSVIFSSGPLTATFKDMALEKIAPPCDGFFGARGDLEPFPAGFKRALVSLAFAARCREPVLLVGPTSFKSCLMSKWESLIASGKGVRSSSSTRVYLTPDSESADLIGTIAPFTFFQLLERFPSDFEACVHALLRSTGDDQVQPLLQEVRELRVEVEQYRALILPVPRVDVAEEAVSDTLSDASEHTEQAVDPNSNLGQNDLFGWDKDSGSEGMAESSDDEFETSKEDPAWILPSDESDLDDDEEATHQRREAEETADARQLRKAITGHIRKLFTALFTYLQSCVKPQKLIYNNLFRSLRLWVFKLDGDMSKKALDQDDPVFSRPIFDFRDGPVTIASKQSRPLFLEDYDLPSQAVTERLNSLLEPEPHLCIQEDLMSNGQDNTIELQEGFQVIATIHQKRAGQRIKVSPATLSR